MATLDDVLSVLETQNEMIEYQTQVMQALIGWTVVSSAVLIGFLIYGFWRSFSRSKSWHTV
jgi:hypothetical protein